MPSGLVCAASALRERQTAGRGVYCAPRRAEAVSFEKPSNLDTGVPPRWRTHTSASEIGLFKISRTHSAARTPGTYRSARFEHALIAPRLSRAVGIRFRALCNSSFIFRRRFGAEGSLLKRCFRNPISAPRGSL